MLLKMGCWLTLDHNEFWRGSLSDVIVCGLSYVAGVAGSTKNKGTARLASAPLGAGAKSIESSFFNHRKR